VSGLLADSLISASERNVGRGWCTQLNPRLARNLAKASGAKSAQAFGYQRDWTAETNDDDSVLTPSAAFVLVVDDDLGTRETFERTLGRIGYQVRTACCAAEGILFAKSQPFDLVLVDLNLPDMSGTDMIRTLLESCETAPPFILISGFLTTAVIVEAMRLGAVDVLEKPISVDDLPGLVASAVRLPARCTPDFHGLDLHQAVPHAHLRLAYKAVEFISSPNDAPTLRQFAHEVGISVGGFRNWCHTAGVRARLYLHLARALRAVYRRERHPAESLENLLQIIDTRTLEKFFIASGGTRAGMPATVEQLLSAQRLVGPEAVAAIRLALRTATEAIE
jgi:CheY-like chemotaxis protein